MALRPVSNARAALICLIDTFSIEKLADLIYTLVSSFEARRLRLPTEVKQILGVRKEFVGPRARPSTNASWA
jgi:hypothetical protein